MPTNKPKKQTVKEFVDSEGGIIGGDRNVSNDSEIETGPVQKPFNDNSEYEKGVSTTTDRAARYKQTIPWFAVYSYGASQGQHAVPNDGPIEESKKVFKKKDIESKIKEDLVKKSKNDGEVWSKNHDGKTDKVIDVIQDSDLTIDQLEKIKKVVLDKLTKNG